MMTRMLLGQPNNILGGFFIFILFSLNKEHSYKCVKYASCLFMPLSLSTTPKKPQPYPPLVPLNPWIYPNPVWMPKLVGFCILVGLWT